MNGVRNRELNRLIEAAIQSFDIPEDLYRLAVRRYEAAGRWLTARAQVRGMTREVYPQGSFRLGTVVRPLGAEAQYDIDMVDRRDVDKSSISQAKLKADVGEDLEAYLLTSPNGQPRLEEGKRCWTLLYRTDPFHMDVLPAIPDPDGRANSILLTDRDVRAWQHSNPIDYAGWFHRTMAEEFAQLRELKLAEMAAGDVEDVPDWTIKTTLQRSVQALKRHRDLRFLNREAQKPASIIITTLAAQSYRGGGSLYDVLADVTERMPSFIECRGGVWWVPNPVQPEENFADRWGERPELASAFFEWLDRARTDFIAIGSERGLDKAVGALSRGFGDDSGQAAAKSFGSGFTSASQTGRLGVVSAVGALGTTPRYRAPRHTFHGDDAFPE
ncbi:MAG: nucleotidyltransferase [Acidobacteriia bacterium]|nr:nucleotidyltransferase [Terriglobia bacterium]